MLLRLGDESLENLQPLPQIFMIKILHVLLGIVVVPIDARAAAREFIPARDAVGVERVAADQVQETGGGGVMRLMSERLY